MKARIGFIAIGSILIEIIEIERQGLSHQIFDP